MQITPAPTDEEAAAIVAAVDALWPRPAVPVAVERRLLRAEIRSWRWSGRWWAARKIPADRRRP